ncbi:MAG: HAMP domain-containing protein [Planctomycetes bacterium]|nr:HAMP domain-containing protein [Planctomycetota bacterium]
MSYRTFKKALGETNLERKCRFLFGACLLPLIAGSFWWYGSRTDKIVIENNRPLAELAVNFAMFEAHQEILTEGALLDDNLFSGINKVLIESLRSGNFNWKFLHPKNDQGIGSPEDNWEWDLIDKWKEYGSDQKLNRDAAIEQIQKLPKDERPWAQRSSSEAPSQSPEQSPEEVTEFYQYYQPILAKQGCITCHSKPGPDVYWPELQIGDLLAVVRIQIDMKETNAQLAFNQSMLAIAAIVTVFLAMIALYVIVRYVIVKPLRHLRDVSNAIRSGDVEQRAEIHTGDEFEDLGAAFNRMLRQLLRQQDELREVNGELDGKIDEMAQANLRLFEMNQHKSDFLATISHELRTPLNSIIGFSDLLSSVEQLDEKELRYAFNIQRSGKQLLEMINGILDLAKIESGKLEVRLSEVVVGTVIATQCDLARPLSGKKNIDLACKIAPDLPVMLQDRGKIEQILNNLLSNAIKFTPDGGRIDVEAHRDQRGDLRLRVTDTGVGISESEQGLVFEKFRQGTTVMPGGNAMTREYSGTGLGLSIVRELCRLLGGDITLESELGKGSTFTVHLPWALTELPTLDSPLAEELRLMTKPRHETVGIAPTVERSLD